MAADQFNPVAGAIQFFRQQLHQSFVRRRVHRRRRDFDFQFAANGSTNFIRRRARLEFYGQQRAIRLGAEEIGKWHKLRWLQKFQG